MSTNDMMRRRGKRRGATLVLVALSMTVILGFAAMAVDLSQMAAYRSELQRAADAGAHAGAIQLTKGNFDSAATIGSSFAAANVVFGKAPVVDTIQYGIWNNATGAFTALCTGVTCAKSSVKAADAMRIVVHGGGPTVFAGILGFFGFNVQTRAIGWAAPTVTRSGCIKPVAMPYSILTKALNLAEGHPLAFDTTRFPLSQEDLDTLRENPTAIRFCVKEGLPLFPCTAAEAGPNRIRGTFLAVDLLLGELGLGSFANNLGSTCTPVGPEDLLMVESTLGAIVQTLLGVGTDTWCNNFGTNPCIVKTALWTDSSTVGAATTGIGCGPTLLLNGCVRVQMAGSFVLTRVVSFPGSVRIEGYFSNAIDNGPIGAIKGTLQRPVLVQ